MEKKILLVDESITVQKVVSLTLDKSLYQLQCVKTRSDAIEAVKQQAPDLVLVSDQTSDLNADTFPKEFESWIHGPQKNPPFILITTHEISEKRGYQHVLRKPFSPKKLQEMVATLTTEQLTTVGEVPSELSESVAEYESHALENRFNNKFSDEANLVNETFARATLTTPQAEAKPEAPPAPPAVSPPPPSVKNENLWAAPKKNEQNTAAWKPKPNDSSTGYQTSLSPSDLKFTTSSGGPMGPKELEAKINQVLNEIVPPIVERLVKERLDSLLDSGNPSSSVYSTGR